jgi:hypothetical protein
MRIFNLNKQYNIVCNWQNTKNGFKHVATLHKNGFSIYETKICYLNRTWERFEYESILIKTIDDNFTGKEKTRFLEVIKMKRY